MARSINSGSDKISAANTITPASSWTVSVWAKVPNFTTLSYGTFVENELTPLSQYNFFIGNSASANKMACYLASGSSIRIDPGAITLPTNTWFHVVVTFVNGSTSVLQIFVNGVFDSQSTNVIVSQLPGVNLNMGNAGGGGSVLTNGSLADVAWWNGIILTQPEITALAKGARPYTIRPSSLIAWYPLDGLQSPEPDLSGNARNGTLTGTSLAPGPPVMQFTPRWPQFLTTAAAALGIAVWPYRM